jgi:anti-sigma regulatory factor (Ser/Thr protein kinase)
MKTIVPTRPTVRPQRRILLAAVAAAAAEARRQVRDAIYSWDVPVDESVAVLLTSELVTNAIRHEAAGTVMLAISYAPDCLRIDVHDTADGEPMLIEAPADAEAGRGLNLVASLAKDWGWYHTAAGKAVYFKLAFG